MMLDNDQSKVGFSVVYIVFFFVALVLAGGFLDQSHAETGALMIESQGQANDRLDNIELAESSQGNEVAMQMYAE